MKNRGERGERRCWWARGARAERQERSGNFDEQVDRVAGKVVVVFGGLGILAALVMSTIALVISSNKSTATVIVRAPSTAAQRPTAGKPPLAGNALGAQLFVSGKPESGAIGCGSCHTMKAAGTSGTIGPNLDKELSADPPSATRQSIVNPNKEIVSGYSANVMPHELRDGADQNGNSKRSSPMSIAAPTRRPRPRRRELRRRSPPGRLVGAAHMSLSCRWRRERAHRVRAPTVPAAFRA